MTIAPGRLIAASASGGNIGFRDAAASDQALAAVLALRVEKTSQNWLGVDLSWKEDALNI
ncbi:hypothetical protein LJR220_001611 [Bradyrhizobium sp. LjRoot220]|uniref:hypothetical protein n=1 Tax=Bradyrhizobium sp. LjRoot220 TaxID=3342284 RepID=UPI003ECDD7F7